MSPIKGTSVVDFHPIETAEGSLSYSVVSKRDETRMYGIVQWRHNRFGFQPAPTMLNMRLLRDVTEFIEFLYGNIGRPCEKHESRRT